MVHGAALTLLVGSFVVCYTGGDVPGAITWTTMEPREHVRCEREGEPERWCPRYRSFWWHAEPVTDACVVVPPRGRNANEVLGHSVVGGVTMWRARRARE